MNNIIQHISRAMLKHSDLGLPLYQQLETALRENIDEGRLTNSIPLPGERDIAQSLDISRVTVRKAIQNLVKDGILTQRQGAGTFVSERMEQPLDYLSGFTEDMQLQGLNSGVVWLERKLRIATKEEVNLLRLSKNERVAHLYRLRTANEKPMALEMAVLSERIIPDPEAINGSLYDHLNEKKLRPTRANQRFRAGLCNEEQMTFLRIAAGSPVLFIERRSFLADGTPIEVTRSNYRGDSYDFVSELTIG